MTERNFEFKDPRGGAAIGVRVVTRTAQTEIAGKTEDGTVKVRLVASSASDADANKELTEFIAGQLGVLPEKVEVVAGADARDKILSIEGLTSGEVEKRLFPQG
jgi:uncharacterized protein YggU (UPF0235/DUF167 family)